MHVFSTEIINQVFVLQPTFSEEIEKLRKIIVTEDHETHND